MKTLLPFLLLLAIALNLQAQEPTPAQPQQPAPTQPTEPAPAKPKEKQKIKFRFGTNIGVNSTIAGGGPSGYSVSSEIGFHGGVYCQITGIWKRLYVQPEVDYYFNSYKFESRNAIENREDRVNTHTIQIPVTVGYVLIQAKKLYWVADTGPLVSILAGVSDNDFGINRDYYHPVVASWRIETTLRIAKLTLNAGFDAGMSKFYEGSNERIHTWYASLGFGL